MSRVIVGAVGDLAAITPSPAGSSPPESKQRHRRQRHGQAVRDAATVASYLDTWANGKVAGTG